MSRVVIDYSPHEVQRAFHNSNARFRILCWGRRTGKDRSSIQESIKQIALMLAEDRPASLVPRVHWWFVAPSFPLARQTWNELLAFMPPQLIKRIDRSELYIELHNGGLVEMKSADKPEHLVGVGLDGVTITEAARVQQAAWEENIRPTLSSPMRGPGMAGKGLAIINSTPKGRNWFWTLYERGRVGSALHDPDYWSSHAPSLANPYLLRSEWDAARTQLPENVFKQEYMAEFLADNAGVFRNIDACAIGEFRPPEHGRRYSVGVDLARLVDFTVITVMDRDTLEVVHWERFNQIRWDLQRERIVDACTRYNSAPLVIDATSLGDPIVEALQDALGQWYPIEGYKFSQDTKERLVQNLQIAMQDQTLKYPNIPELLLELKAFEYEYTRTGRFKYAAAPGFHDDTVISLGLALMGCAVEENETYATSIFG